MGEASPVGRLRRLDVEGAAGLARRHQNRWWAAPPLRDYVAMSGKPEGFSYRLRKNGDVEVLHLGRPAVVLRGAAAARFLTDVDGDDPQELMARVTGNYRHGNERTAKNHPRNRRR
jgi:hypothetical protein